MFRPLLALLPVGSVGTAAGLTWLMWPFIQPSSSPLFFVAVMASSIYGGMLAGLSATVLSTAAIAFLFMPPQFSFNVGSDDAFRLIVFGVVALLANSIAAERRSAQLQQQRLIDDLRLANQRIQTLSDLLPICPHCKRVRTAEASWAPIERYLDEAPDLRVSHAICPDCSLREYPEFHPSR
jgi:K+-sensing histidine kinase KdpD